MGSLTAISGTRIYLDTNILIYALEDFGRFSISVQAIFGRIDAGELRGVTSELALAEVLVKPIRDANAKLRTEHEALLASDGPLDIRSV